MLMDLNPLRTASIDLEIAVCELTEQIKADLEEREKAKSTTPTPKSEAWAILDRLDALETEVRVLWGRVDWLTRTVDKLGGRD